MGSRILHVAIADDWGASGNFGEYEVSTRGVGFFDAGYIRATTAGGIDDVLQSIYGDLRLPLLLVVIDVAALEAAGVAVRRVADQNTARHSTRIEGILPMDDAVIVATLAIERVDGVLRVPDLTGLDVID
ncbi:hypothetical protein QCD70_08125 [Agreia sp. PsM10]|uniref:hypothetical protein n=1 Tax=Agreia sp. PsM10 TaxID=3030533 RepID=UPI00263AE13A|nr:hypothetical protein [Agreia sp. PsM10]MDN4640207.1 hypothetical protein [Agreia sp. PsM10]